MATSTVPRNTAGSSVGVGPFVQLCRPKHSVKNLVIFVPWMLTGGPFTGSLVATFATFVVASFGIYALNDAIDSKYDRDHPTKYFRPVASGRIAPSSGFGFALLCFVTALGTGLLFAPHAAALAATYIVINIVYSVVGKDLPVIDILMVSSGFVIRVVAGVLAIGPFQTTSWIVVPVFLASAGLALGKRLAKRSKAGDASSEHLRMPAFYTESNLRGMLFFLSHLSVLIGGWILLDDRLGLANQIELPLLTAGALAITCVVILSRVVYLIVHRHIEPASAFTADAFTVLGAVVLASTLLLGTIS